MMCTELGDINDFDLALENFSDLDMDAIIRDIQNPQQKPMDQWDNPQVLEFILNEIKRYRNINHNDLERFRCISGYIFKNLSEEHCQVLSNSPDLGREIYSVKEQYVSNYATGNLIDENSFFDGTDSENSSLFDSCSRVPAIDRNFECYAKPDKKAGRPRSKPYANKNGRRSEKLWEFLLHLLADSKTCPQLIKWENFQEGTFKFVQSSKVARLWGNRKQNDNMTYEKFSRAMRYYYKSKVLLPVPGKRLVYKFGPHAEGWKNIKPIV